MAQAAFRTKREWAVKENPDQVSWSGFFVAQAITDDTWPGQVVASGRRFDGRKVASDVQEGNVACLRLAMAVTA